MKKKIHLRDNLAAAQNEEELKFRFVKFFDLPISTKNRIDLYTEQILFEFKFDDNLKNLQTRAKVVAQALYYIRRLKFGDDDRPPSEDICVVAKNFAAFFKTEVFADFYNDRNIFDWDLKPSSPCKKLVAALADCDAVIRAHVYDFANIDEDIAFATLINNTRKRQSSLFALKKIISQKNFYAVFRYWKSFFGEAVENGHKPSEYFITDIEQGKSSLVDNNSVIFRMTGGEIREKIINPDEYKFFWSQYAKISSAREIIAIRQKMDVITEINLRRYTGEFYTPLAFSEKAFDYLTRTVGDWWTRGNFRLWDMAAGTGNLEFAIPPDAQKFCYVSTLIKDEADYCAKIFPDATAFQFDYLNDNADKLPQNLRDDLADPEISWIIFINPPYATANNYERDKTKITKDSVSMTAVRKLMTADGMGKASQELFSQFVYRISKDFSNRQVWLGMFSKVKYLNANADQKLRDKIFNCKFERGFVFNSKNFDGCKAQFPVGFLIWNLGEKIPLESQEITLDVYDAAVEKVAEKIFHVVNQSDTLNKWIDRPRRTKKFPPMSSGINIKRDKVHCDMVAENFLADLMSLGNDFVHQNYTAILSGVYSDGHNISVTPENFEQCMIIHMVRRLPKATWLNDRDQFMQPTKPLPREFVTDAVIWSLFAPSNQTASLRDVLYEGEIYQIRNNFFPFELEELQAWECTSPEIRWRLAAAHEDRFAATWIKNCREELSSEARTVLAAGKVIYKKFFAELSTLDVRRWKIADWDASWYQVRMSLGATVDLSALSAKLLPQIYELGFLRDEVKYF